MASTQIIDLYKAKLLKTAKDDLPKYFGRDESSAPERELFGYMDNDAAPHNYHYWPYTSGEAPGHEPSWRPPVISSEQVAIPAEAHQLCMESDVDVRFGLFTEIHRAFLIADNAIYIWNYEDSSDAIIHRETGQAIRAVGLVVPKPYVFPPSVKYLLVVATPVEVRLLAMTFENNSVHQKLDIRPTGLSCLTDGAGFIKIAGTSLGRIFLIGDTGYIHEVEYSSQREYNTSWTGLLGLKRRCSQKVHSGKAWGAIDSISAFVGAMSFLAPAELADIVIDHHRNLVYTLTVGGVIEMFTLGNDGQSLISVAKLSDLGAASRDWRKNNQSRSSDHRYKALFDQSNHAGTDPFATKPNEVTLTWPLAALQVIPPSESRRVHLMAISEAGCRFYFSSYSSKAAVSWRNPAYGKGLQLMHVRPPPPAGISNDYQTSEFSKVTAEGFRPNLSSRALTYTHVLGYSNNTCLVAVAREDEDEGDHVVALSLDPSKYKALENDKGGREALRDEKMRAFAEAVSEVHTTGKVHALEAVPLMPSIYHDVLFNPSGAIALPNGESAPLAPTYDDATAASLLPGMPGRMNFVGHMARLLGKSDSSAVVGQKRTRSSTMDTTLPRAGAEYAASAESTVAHLQAHYIHASRRREWCKNAPVSAPSSDRQRIGRQSALEPDRLLISDVVGGGYGGAGGPLAYNVYAIQHEAALASSFICLTHSGLHRLRQIRPIDELATFLSHGPVFPPTNRRPQIEEESDLPAIHGLTSMGRRLEGSNASRAFELSPQAQQLSTFFQLHGAHEACAMCVALACGAMEEDSNQLLRESSTPQHARNRAPDSLARSAVAVLHHMGGTATLRDRSPYADKSCVVFANKTHGVLLFMSRLLRPIWRCSLFVTSPRGNQPTSASNKSSKNRPSVLPRFTEMELEPVVTKLRNLKAAMIELYGDLSDLDGTFDPVTLGTQRALFGQLSTLQRSHGHDSTANDFIALSSAEATTQELEKIVCTNSNALPRVEELERRYVTCMYYLLDRAVQALSVMMVLSRTYADVDKYLKVLEDESFDAATAMSYEQLACAPDGTALARVMLEQLTDSLRTERVTSDIHDVGVDEPDTDNFDSTAAFFDALSEELRQNAPDFFSAEDSHLWRALVLVEMARKTSVTTHAGEQRRRLQKAVQHVINAAKPWSLPECIPQIHDLCRRFVSLGDYEGVLTMCLSAAYQIAGSSVNELSDASLQAVRRLEELELTSQFSTANLNTHTNGTKRTLSLRAANVGPKSSVSQASNVNHLTPFQMRTYLRIQCYAIIIDILHTARTDPHPSLVSTAKAERRVQNSYKSHSNDTLDDRNLAFRYLLSRILSSEDALLHEEVFKYMISDEELADMLIRSQSRHLENFLRHRTEDLRWLFKFLLAHKRYNDAAYLQKQRAEENHRVVTENPDLQERINRLSRAISLAEQHSALPGAVNQSVLIDWKRDLQVAEIQLEVLQGLRAQRESAGIEQDERLDKLQQDLTYLRLDLQNLFFEYAQPLQLHEACLAILAFAAQPQTQSVVITLWKHIIDSIISSVVENETDPVTSRREAIMASLSATVTRIGRRFWKMNPTSAVRAVRATIESIGEADETVNTSQYVFTSVPAFAITKMLEEFAYNEEFDHVTGYNPGWVSVDILGGINIPWLVRYDMYRALARQAGATGDDSLQLHLLRAMGQLLSVWVLVCQDPSTERSHVQDLYRVSNQLLHEIQEEYKMLLRSTLHDSTSAHIEQMAKQVTTLMDDVQSSLRSFQANHLIY